MLTNPAQAKLIQEVTVLLHKEKLRESAMFVSDFLKLGLKVDSDDPSVCYPVLQYILHWLLNNNALEEAAMLLWSKTIFNPEPQYSKDVWKLFDEANFGLIMGGASCSKSYTCGVRLFLEWVRDPSWTSVRVVGPSEEHLENNLFSHLVSLHRDSKIPMPGQVGELFIGLDRRNLLSSIKGVVIPVSSVKKAGRLQGTKRKNRLHLHPVFGPQSRLFVFIDEIENVPGGVWSDIDNLMANLDEAGSTGLRIFGAFNPTNRDAEVGKRCVPPFGWEAFDPDQHFRWTSTRGWEVLRLDGEKSENVVAGKVIYPGLQTRAGLDQLAVSSGGRNSVGYCSMGRGSYPVAGMAMTIISPGLVSKMKGEPIWFQDPTHVGSADLALEGLANAVFTKGLFGLASGIKLPPSLEFPLGRTVMFKNDRSQVVPRQVLLAEQQFIIPKGDTVAMAEAIIQICKRAGIRGEYLCIDRTGNGAGVADLIKHNWSTAIHDVNYSEGPSDSKIMEEDKLTAKEEYDRVNSELWFALQRWTEFMFFFIHPQLSMEHLQTQLTQRQYRMLGKKKKIESKRDYIDRATQKHSPDEADSLTLLVHAARKGSGFTPSMTHGGGSGSKVAWEDFGQTDLRIDVSNRTDYLDATI